MAEWQKQSSSRPGTNNTFVMSGSSQATAAFGAQTYQIRVATAGQPAWVTIGDGTPVATSTNSMSMPTNWVEYFTVVPGQKAACLQQGTAGSLTITEFS